MTVCTSNRKGGVGKTSVAGNVAYELARRYRVVLVDADPQGSLTAWLLDGERPRGELADLLFERRELRECTVEVSEGLHLVPTFPGGDLRQYAENRAGSEPYAMTELCDRLEGQGFAFVMVDLAPSLGTFEQGAIAAVDRALLVVEPEYLSIGGLDGLLGDLQAVIRKRRVQVRYDWLIVNRLHAGFARHRVYLGALREQWRDYRLFVVRQGAGVSESQTTHEPLAVYAPNDERALPGYREIAEALGREYGET